MTTPYGYPHEQPLFEPREKQPLGKISMWFGIATTPIFVTSALLVMAHGYEIIWAAILHFFVLIITGSFALVSLILGGLALHAKHQQRHAYIGMGLTLLAAIVGIGTFYIH